MISGTEKRYEENKTRTQRKRVVFLPFSAALGWVRCIWWAQETVDLWPVEWAVVPNARHFQNNTLYAKGLSG